VDPPAPPGRPLAQDTRREHVEPAGRDGAHPVAPRGGRVEAAQERQRGLREIQGRRRAMEHDGHVAGRGGEPAVKLVAETLEVLERPGHVLRVG